MNNKRRVKNKMLPSFPHLLVTEGQSNRTHPALLLWLRIHGSLRLQGKPNRNFKRVKCKCAQHQKYCTGFTSALS